MDDLNASVIDHWRDAGFRPEFVMDVGVSSRITTAEWLDALVEAGLSVRMTGTDVALWARVVRIRPGLSVLEADGHVLLYILLGVPIRPWHGRLDYLTGYGVVIGLLNRFVAPRANEAAGGEPLLLLSPEVRDAPIEWVEDDVFAANPPQLIGRFDAIRAANLLNREYFDAHQIRKAASNLKARLAGPGSRFVVNRTEPDGRNHATMFCLDEACSFEVEARFGNGSEVEEIVLAA